MRRALVLILLLALCSQARAEPEPRDRVAVEYDGPDEVHVGEPFLLVLRLGVDGRWLARHGVARHARPLDLPLEVDASALRETSGTRTLKALLPEDVHRVRTAVNGEAVELVHGRVGHAPGSWTWLALEKRIVALEPGVLEVVAPVVRFSYADRFEEDALGARVPVDAREVVVTGAPRRIRVLPLPPEGRPTEFGGAIGRFTMSAAAGRTEVEVGQTFRLTLTIGGEGNLEVFEPPRIPAEAGFHVYGVIDDRAYPKRTIVYDLAAQRADVTSVPAIELPVFDPEPPAGYRVLRTEPLPLTVRSSPDRLVIEPVRFEADGDGTGRRFRWLLGGACALLVVGGALWFLVRRRRRVESAPDPRTERLGAALGALRVALGEGADLSEPFAEVLAARLGSPRAAAIGPDLAARLTAAGVGSDDAREAARAMERLVAARYGGGVAAEDRDRILPLADRVAGRTDDA